jgi:hypothetical protein
MSDWLMPVVVFAGYLIIVRWLLPKFGVPT